MTEDNTAVSAVRAFHISGVGHCNAAFLIHEGLAKRGTKREDSTWIALGNVIGFAAEVTLKAYLAGHDVDRRILSKREYGHNLLKLLDESAKLGLANDVNRAGEGQAVMAIRRYIGMCGENYTAFDYRYLEAGEVSVLKVGEATQTIIEALRVVLAIVEDRWINQPASDPSI